MMEDVGQNTGFSLEEEVDQTGSWIEDLDFLENVFQPKRDLKREINESEEAGVRIPIPDIKNPANHCVAYGDFCFDVISHTYNVDLFSDIIPNLFQKCKANFCSNFTKRSREYLEKHHEKFLSEGVFSIPYLDENTSSTEPFLNGQINSIMNTMKDWCCKNGCDEILKGFVIYGYNLDSHLKLLKVPEKVLQDHLYETSEDSHETVVVYNAVIQVILLIRIAVGESLENEMKLSTNDTIKFVLTFHDVLDKSGVKVINLLVTDEVVNYQSKCESCKQQMISMKIFSSSEVYQRWWKKKKQNFGVSVIHKNLNKYFRLAISAKALVFLTFFQLSSGNQSSRVLPYKTIYMTPDQIKFFYSPPKHAIINDCPGSGNSVGARKKTEIIVSRMKPYKSLHDIVCDSSQKSRRGMYMVMTEPEITTVEQLLKKDTDKTKLNLIFDEFDSESLNEVVEKKLNDIFKINKKLKDSNIIVIHQQLQEDREESNNRSKGNYEMLQTFSELVELICDMIDATENKVTQVAENQTDNTEQQVRKEEIQSIERSISDTSKSGSTIIDSLAVPVKEIGRTKTRIIVSDHQPMERDKNFEPFKQRLEKASAKTSKESFKQRFESFKQRFESIEQRLESFKQRLEKASAKTSKESFKQRLESFKQRLESFKPRFERIKGDLNSIECDLDWIECDLDWIECDLEWMELHFNSIERRFEWMELHFKSLKHVLDSIECRFDWIEGGLDWIEGRLDATKKSLLEYSFSIPASKGGKVEQMKLAPGDSSGPSRD